MKFDIGKLARAVLATAFTAASAPFAYAQVVEALPVIMPLTGIKPNMPATTGIIRDQLAAQQLGKALFWDVQAGIDGVACASCHYQAGADIRTKNQVNSGMAQVKPGPDLGFSKRRNGTATGPNAEMAATDFPFHELTSSLNRDSTIKFDTNDVMGSAGVFSGFPITKSVISHRLQRNVGADVVNRLAAQRSSKQCNLAYDPANNPFHAGNQMHRQATARQSPSTINAVFYNRAFWDGRANNAFNGVDPFGWRSNIASPKVGVLVDMLGVPYLEKVIMPDAALASQAVGPPLSSVEMACQGQTFADLGRRLLGLKPLAGQSVHPLDSSFGQTPQILAVKPAKGLNTTYSDMIRKAFEPKYWASPSRYTIDDFGQVLKDTTKGYSQMEQNFSFFWGLSIMMYESTLISDQSPFDTGAMTASAQRGQTIFSGKAGCIQCHNGPVFSVAAAPLFGIPAKPLDPANPLKPDAAPFAQLEQITRVDNVPGIYDAGFYNIGLRTTSEDLGVGGVDPYGTTLSYARQFLMMMQFLRVPDEVKPPFCIPEPPVPVNPLLPPDKPKVCTPLTDGSRAVVDGAFKTPTLRNVGLTPPYMHNGAFATLEQVVAFYNRGGDRRNTACGDTTGFNAECTNVHPAIQPLNLTAAEQADLVSFLKSLTDNRVACHSGPFDHPELQLQKGHVTAPSPATPKRAADIMVTIPALGRNGLQGAGLPCFPNSGNLFGDTQTVFSQVAK